MVRKIIGSVGVDSGQILITDPCYLGVFKSDEFDSADKDKSDRSYSYSGCCKATLSKKQGDVVGLGESGVAVRSGYGDGVYPVYAHYNKDGRIVKVEIVFVRSR